MDLHEYALRLKEIKCAPYDQGLYTNRFGNYGYKAVFKIGSDWYWYSVSGTSTVVHPREVAEAVARGNVRRCGQYKRDGFEATVYFEGRSYMISAGDGARRLN